MKKWYVTQKVIIDNKTSIRQMSINDKMMSKKDKD